MICITKIRLHRKLYLSLILLVAVIVAGWLVYSQKDLFISKLSSDRSSEKAPIYQAKIHPNPNQAEDTAKKRTTPSGRQSIQTGSNDEQDSADLNISSRPPPQMPVQQKNQKKPIFISPDKNKPLEQTSTAKENISQSQPAASQNQVQQNQRQSPLASTEKTQAMSPQVPRAYRRLDDDKLKLQAIAWSKSAAQRIAVINGHVVREGESVAGFSVNQIRQEDVIVNDGTESWQLEFGLK
jgi:FtsZ-interacting cell division protein ZipA